jgi:hypothetical protein
MKAVVWSGVAIVIAGVIILLVGGMIGYHAGTIMSKQFEDPYSPLDETYADAFDQANTGALLVNVGQFLALLGIGIGFIGSATGPVPQPTVAYGWPQQPPQYPPQEPPPPP